MLTTSKPLGSRARTALAAGLALWVAGCTPPGPKALLDGERLLREGRTEDAIRRLRTAVEFLPSQPQAWNHLGLAYHAAKKPSDAVEAYQQALRLDRNLAAAYFNSGCLYLENGEPGLATDALWAFVGLQPRVIEGWVKLGQAQLRTRRWDQAERSFQEALRLSPGRVDALNGVGIAFHQRRKVQEAWSSFTNAVIRDPSFAPAWLNLGVIAHQSGAPGKAVQAYRQYAALRPTSAQQLGLEAVIRKLELPPPSPTIQLPPAAPAGSGETNAPPVAAAAPPAPDAKSSDAAARVSAATGTPGAARPPPVASAPDATIPAPSESPAAVAGTEKALVAATAAESTPSTNREAGSVAVPVPQESPSPASPAPVPLLASNAVA
ncbi:MAG: tetratricopeptide repeat protein, partial [Verrucomicrobiales bacterium]|nr:tetratricopeptide repeat protein [Verrucomicrobiales bacterium]